MHLRHVFISCEQLAGHSAAQVATALSRALSATHPSLQVSCIPLAAGGPGTSGIFSGTTVTLPTVNAAQELTEASYLLLSDRAGTPTQAVIECAALANSQAGDTYGIGVLIADALSRGVSTVVLATGGMQTCDGGTGILTALGIQPQSADHRTVSPGVTGLEDIALLDTTAINTAAAQAEFLVLADSDPELDPALQHLAKVLEIDSTTPLLGAGGGLGIGLLWLTRLLRDPQCPTVNVPGALALLHNSGAMEAAQQADLWVLVGEHCDQAVLNDSNTVMGMLGQLSINMHKPVAVVAGEVQLPTQLPQAQLDLKAAAADLILELGGTVGALLEEIHAPKTAS